MGLYIAENQCKYEVADGKLDEAVKWLEGRRGGTYRTASYRTDTSIVTEECGEMFGGDVSFSWQRPVTDFLERFCLPGSYATFRNDDEFCWLMAELKPNGKVEWSEEAIENPFWKRCEELEEGTEGIGGNTVAVLEYEPAGDESQVAVAEIAGRTWMFYVYDEEGGGAFGAVEIDDPDASSAERVASRWFGSEDECKDWLSGVAVGVMAGARAKEEK